MNIKELSRNKTRVKQVLLRDIGLCRCCGFKGDEVHHITPLIYGGSDEVTNMITLCSECHRTAPNTKLEFKDYMDRGGSKLYSIIGKAVLDMERQKVPYSIYYPTMLQIISWLRQIDITNAIESSNLKKVLEIKDIDWNE